MPAILWLNRNAEKLLVSTLLAAIVVLIFANVIMRYVFNASLSWGEELTLWLFVWFVWIGVSYAFQTEEHVRITFLRDRFPASLSYKIDFIVGLLVLGFLGAIVFEAVKLIQMPFVLSQKSVVLGFPIAMLYASAPVGATLSMVRVIQYLLKTAAYISSSAEEQPC